MAIQAMAAPARSRAMRNVRLAGIWLLSLCLLWSGMLGTAAAAGLSVSRYTLKSVAVDGDGRGISAIDLRLKDNLAHISYYDAAQDQGGYFFPQGDFWTSYTLSQLAGQLDSSLPVSVTSRSKANGGVEVNFSGVSADRGEVRGCTLSADPNPAASSLPGSPAVAGGCEYEGPLTPFDFMHFLITLLAGKYLNWEDSWAIRGMYTQSALDVAYTLKDELRFGISVGGQSPVMTALSAVLGVLGLFMASDQGSTTSSKVQASAATPEVSLLYAKPGTLMTASLVNDRWTHSTVASEVDTDHVSAWFLTYRGSSMAVTATVNGVLSAYLPSQATAGGPLASAEQTWRQVEVAAEVDGKHAATLDSSGRLLVAYRDADLGKLMLAIWDGQGWQHLQIWNIGELRDCRVQVDGNGQVRVLTVERADSQDQLRHYLVTLPS